jgi:hypothetical protein
MAEDDFARRAPRATPDLRNPTSRQTSFLTGDEVSPKLSHVAFFLNPLNPCHKVSAQ